MKENAETIFLQPDYVYLKTQTIKMDNSGTVGVN